jgi:hypothetical protein
MADYLALDWDDQRLVGVAAQVASKKVDVRAVLDFTWGAAELPSEDPQAAGKRLRAELDRVSAANGPVIVSLPREDAIIRLLELPECTDDELPELVRFQAVTRSTVPLDRLLLDYLPLPTLPAVPGRRVWMATIAKSSADRVAAVLTAAGLEAAAIRLSSIGAGELVAHQADAAAASDRAALIVSCVDLRVEITAIWQSRIVLMHAATLSSHDPPEDQLAQILAETARSTVALSDAARGLVIDSGWLIGTRTDKSPLAESLSERFGFEFHVIKDVTTTPGVTADGNASLADSPAAWAPLGMLLGQASQRIDSVDFLHPRRQHAKPDRRKLWIGVGAAAAILVALVTWGLIQRRVWQLDDDIARMTLENQRIQELLKKNSALIETAGAVDEWTRRDIDWLDQFRLIEQAKGGADKLYLTSFDANVSARNTLATIIAAGRARLPNDVDDFEDRLHEFGYRVTPKEISEDTDPLYPVKIDLNLDLVEVLKPPASAGSSSAAAKPEANPVNPSSGAPRPPATSAPPGNRQANTKSNSDSSVQVSTSPR